MIKAYPGYCILRRERCLMNIRKFLQKVAPSLSIMINAYSVAITNYKFIAC
jgi:hypothetical protein